MSLEMETTNNTDNSLPEYIDPLPASIKTNLIGTRHYFDIPTNSNTQYASRRKIILEAYDILLKKNGGKIIVFNEFLGCNIEITRKISRKKASNKSVRNWQSTYAVLKIVDVVKYASSDRIRHVPAKPGMQQNAGFSYVIPLSYTFKNKKKPYLNFSVELIVGEMIHENDGRKYVQYSVELMEIKKAENS